MARRRCQLGFWLVCCLLGASSSVVPAALYAETRTAAALTPEAVWETIEAAQDGDTVLLPAGTAVWTRGWNTGHGARMKAITIQGAGIDKTVIGDNRPKADAAPFFLLGVEGKPFRVTGITFDGTGYPNAGNWGGLMTIRGTCKSFRIDDCKFKNTDHMLVITGDTYGLVDHCFFEGTESHGGNVQPIVYVGPGAPNYRKPLALGSAEAMYLEDNEVYVAEAAGANGKRSGNNPWIAPSNGARVVIRHNKIVNAELEIYGPGKNQKEYGCQTAEIYDNQFSTDDNTPQIIIGVAAGVALVFDNTVTGTSYRPPVILLQNHRAYYVMRGSIFGKADGTNPYDGNQIPAGQVGAGYPCMGQPGRGTDVDGDGIFEPSPCYAWNNTINGRPLLMAVSGRDANEAAQIVEGREFFNEEPPEGYYTPYVYPHPWQEGWEDLMKSVAAPAGDPDSSTAAAPASKP